MNRNQRAAIRADVLNVMRRSEQRWWVATQLSRAIADLPVEGGGQRLQPRATAVSDVLGTLLAEGLVARDPHDAPGGPARYALSWAAQEEARERRETASAAGGGGRPERLTRGLVLDALKGADVEWRTAEQVYGLVSHSLAWDKVPSPAEVREALRHLVAHGPDVMRRSARGREFEYRLCTFRPGAGEPEDSLAPEEGGKTDPDEAPREPEHVTPREQVIRSLAASADVPPTVLVTDATLPNPAEPGFSMRRAFDGTWSVSVEGLTEVEARALAVTFGDRMSRRDG